MYFAIHREKLSWIIIAGIFILAAALDGMRYPKTLAENKEVMQIQNNFSSKQCKVDFTGLGCI